MGKSTKDSVTRGQAFHSWTAGAFNIGEDVGKGITLFMPQGLLGPLHKDRLLAPFELLAKWIVGPAFGGMFAIIGLLPALYQGFYLKRLMKEQAPNWTMDLVKDHSVKTVWGALSLSVLGLFAIMTGLFALPPITLPAMFFIPSITLGPITSALILPITAAMAVSLVVGVGYGAMHLAGALFQFSWGTPKKATWKNALKGTINANCEDEAIKNKLTKEIEFELETTAQAYNAVAREVGHEPTLKELKRNNVLSYYQLQDEQKSFVKSLNDPKKYKTAEDKLEAVKERHKRFA